MPVASQCNDQCHVQRHRDIHAVLQTVSNEIQKQRVQNVHAARRRLDLPVTVIPVTHVSQQRHHLDDRQRDEAESLLDDAR